MPINASPHFERAQIEYEQAETTEQKIRCLKKMIALAPKHKGAENLMKNLKKRLAKLKYSKEKEKKSSQSGKQGIRKHEMQVAIIGKTNTGKSTLLKILTNAETNIANYEFTTKYPVPGMMDYKTVQIQIVEDPAIESNFFDKSLAHTADTLLLLVKNINEITELNKEVMNFPGKKIIVFNLDKNISNSEKRKISATLQSKRYNFVLIRTQTEEGIEDLKEKIFKNFEIIRIYTKEPGKNPDMTKPVVLKPGATVKDVAEKILHGFSKKVKETHLTGPSGKFPNQKVGLKHVVKDKDIIEFKTE